VWSAGLGDLGAALEGVVAVHEHLGLDDRDEPRLLAEGGVARERVGVGVDAVRGRDTGPDRDDGAPLGEAGAEPAVLGQAVAEPVQALGDQLAGAAGQGPRPLVDLDPRNHPSLGEEIPERRAVVGLLPDGLVK